jgi:Kef-type K+ transport system membrane component KefB
MRNKKGKTFLFVIIALILGWTLFKQFDFKNLKFEKPALATIYILTFLMSVYFLARKAKEKQ